MNNPISVFWFRRDLRLHDNAGLYHALKSGYSVLPIFIFDTHILNKLEDKTDRRVDFIHQALNDLKRELGKMGSDLMVFHGEPLEIWKKINSLYSVKEVYTNHDYEKYAINRDSQIKKYLNENAVAYYSFKDQCIFENREILSDSGTPYTVFTPYSRKWKNSINPFYKKSYPNKEYFPHFFKKEYSEMPLLAELGFKKTDIILNKPEIDLSIISQYKENRDFPAIKGTTRLSIHLRFGTISARKAVQAAEQGQEAWLNELIWRDFYFNILANFPHINDGKAFREIYDKITWRKDSEGFERWCEGETGFPIVDAGMRELNNTGFMHNRVRMIVASFLCKDLLVDWRLGEAYFAKKLNDYDFSANNGGWQWASGSGCDAAPYFRVFNPNSQTEKFDKNLEYIRKWVPEFQSLNYKPMLDHSMARDRAIRVYKEGLSGV
jgi:deoxyribodipyrimidine photo-lyase